MIILRTLLINKRNYIIPSEALVMDGISKDLQIRSWIKIPAETMAGTGTKKLFH
jgi:hypothetical protein